MLAMFAALLYILGALNQWTNIDLVEDLMTSQLSPEEQKKAVIRMSRGARTITCALWPLQAIHLLIIKATNGDE